MSEQAIHFRDEESIPRKENKTGSRSDTGTARNATPPTSPINPNPNPSLNLNATPLLSRAPSLAQTSGASSSNLLQETKAASSQKYQNSRAVAKLHKSAIFNACSAISDRHDATRSQRHINVSSQSHMRTRGGGGSVQTAHTSTSFNTTRSLLQHDLQDETSVISNRSSITQIKKYFGSSSRNDMYDRYQWLSKKQQIMNNGKRTVHTYHLRYT